MSLNSDTLHYFLFCVVLAEALQVTALEVIVAKRILAEAVCSSLDSPQPGEPGLEMETKAV